MVRILISLVVYLVSIIGNAQTDNSALLSSEKDNGISIDVEINRIISDKGQVYFALYDSENNFNDRKPLKVSNSTIEKGKAKVVFNNLESGIYAVTCYHDANKNGKMDFENNGMPVEDYGATNNVMNYGPPRFSDAKFELKDKDLTFEIKF